MTIDVQNPILKTEQWFDLIDQAKQTVTNQKPDKTEQNKARSVQIGCHIEEINEMLSCLAKHAAPQQQAIIDAAVLALKQVEGMFKENSVKFQLNDVEVDFSDLPTEIQDELCDSLADQVFTSVGVGHRCGFNMTGAYNEVIRSNYSKFNNGIPVVNEQGKIMKGDNYSPPNLALFLKRQLPLDVENVENHTDSFIIEIGQRYINKKNGMEYNIVAIQDLENLKNGLVKMVSVETGLPTWQARTAIPREFDMISKK